MKEEQTLLSNDLRAFLDYVELLMNGEKQEPDEFEGLSKHLITENVKTDPVSIFMYNKRFIKYLKSQIT